MNIHSIWIPQFYSGRDQNNFWKHVYSIKPPHGDRAKECKYYVCVVEFKKIFSFGDFWERI
jgi:hypothetical protein